jgi:putative DNA methylase
MTEDNDRRVIEDFIPIKEISAESSKEKNRRDGNLSTIHVWWARRPLIACRAGVLSSLLKFNQKEKKKNIELIKKVCTWEASIENNKIQSARTAISKEFKHIPKVLDCFAGGGAIPLEAMRLGCESYAVDINPVAHIIEKCTLYYNQKFKDESNQLMTSLQKNIKNKPSLIQKIKEGKEFIEKFAKEKLSPLYPRKDKFNVLAYIWSHSIKCQNPSCNATIPLIRQTWLKHATKGKSVCYDILIENNKPKFYVKEVMGRKEQDGNGTMKKGSVECPKCSQVMDVKYVREYGATKGFVDIPVAVVYLDTQKKQKSFDTWDEQQLKAYEKTKNILSEYSESDIPSEKLPKIGTLGFRVQRYGFKKWKDLFNKRQLTAILVFSEAMKKFEDKLRSEDLDDEFIIATITYLALAVDRLIDRNSIICAWNPHSSALNAGNTFGRQALPMVWDYAESNPFIIWNSAVERIIKYLIRESNIKSIPTTVIRGSSTSLPFNEKYFDAIIIDPPYYDAVPYSDLSDFFYVWLKKNIGHLHKDVFDTPLTPKNSEIIQEPIRHKSKADAKIWYEQKMTETYCEINRTLKDNGISLTVFAHKSTEAWETLINGLLKANLIVTASWPLETERPGRLRAQGSAALASSIFIVCRKRKSEEEGYFNEIKDELKNKVKTKLDQFWEQGISGADFFISAIGPAVEVFGKYKRVMKLTGEEVSVAELLDLVREIVTEYSLHRILKGKHMGQVDEETNFYLLWRWAYNGLDVPYDDGRKLSQALGTEIDELLSKKNILQKKGVKVTLLHPWERKKISNLGEQKGGLPAPMIDVIHRACNLWETGNKKELTEFLEEAGYTDNDTLWNVAQAISDVLPDGDKEKQLIQGLLASKQSIEKDFSKKAQQGKLDSFIK